MMTLRQGSKPLRSGRSWEPPTERSATYGTQ
nr:MAG TPA: hypothetical protein [Caudoviricetes sp.]